MTSRRFIDGIQQEIGSLPLESTGTIISASAFIKGEVTTSCNAILLLSVSVAFQTNSSCSNVGQLNKHGISSISSETSLNGIGTKIINGTIDTILNIASLFSKAFITPPITCIGPYALGTGDYCGCSCNCCPPCPCYTSWTYTYKCGSPAINWFYGCECAPHPSSIDFFAPNIGITDFPDFPDFNSETSFEFKSLDVSVLSEPPYCSIPCVTYTITITTSGCCLYGDGTNFIAVGAGEVCISDAPETICDGNSFTVTINGSPNCVYVNDGDSVIVNIIPPSSLCCSCCLISSEGTLLPDCQVQALKKSLILNRRSTSGANKLHINKKKLLERAAKLRR